MMYLVQEKNISINIFIDTGLLAFCTFEKLSSCRYNTQSTTESRYIALIVREEKILQKLDHLDKKMIK